MSELSPPSPLPEDPVSEDDRSVAVRRVQDALAREELGFDDLDERFDAIYRSTSRGELEAAVSDLTAPPAPATPGPAHPLPRNNTSLIGDLKVGGWVDVTGNLSYGTLIGDITIDLSSATLPDEVEITVWNIIGDATVILPDGARASLEGVMVLGDRKTDLADPWVNGPLIRVRSFKLIGDSKLYSLSRVPEGRFRKLWRRLRQSGNSGTSAS